MDCLLYRTKNSAKVTINATVVNNTVNHASLAIKRLLWLSVFTTLEPPYWMFSRISKVGPNRKLVPSTSQLSFWTVWFRLLGTTFRAEKRNEHASTFLLRSPDRVWKNGGISNILLPKNISFPLIPWKKACNLSSKVASCGYNLVVS